MIDREIASGAKRDPTQLSRLIKREAGDVVLVACLDRLARTRGTSSTRRGTIRTGDGPARARAFWRPIESRGIPKNRLS